MIRKKNLVMYFTRTQSSKKVAFFLKDYLKSDYESIEDTKRYSGIGGFVKAGFSASKKSLTKIKPLKIKLKNYKHIILVFPLWSSHMPPAIRTFLHEYKDSIDSLSIVVLSGGSSSFNIYKEIEDDLKFDVKIFSSIVSATFKDESYKDILHSQFNEFV